MIDLAKIQEQHGELMKGYGKEVSPTILMLGLAEEVGEIARIGLKTEQGVRGYTKPLKENNNLKIEIGDLVMFLCHLCNKLDFNLEQCIWLAFGKVLERHKNNPKDSGDDHGSLQP